jgi:hypothetical protein
MAGYGQIRGVQMVWGQPFPVKMVGVTLASAREKENVYILVILSTLGLRMCRNAQKSLNSGSLEFSIMQCQNLQLYSVQFRNLFGPPP